MSGDNGDQENKATDDKVESKTKDAKGLITAASDFLVRAKGVVDCVVCWVCGNVFQKEGIGRASDSFSLALLHICETDSKKVIGFNLPLVYRE